MSEALPILGGPCRIAFAVLGDAVPYERPENRADGGRYTAERSDAWMKSVGAYAMHARGTWQRATRRPWPVWSRLSVALVVHKATRQACDLDNLAKAILDGSAGAAGLWANDHQIDRLLVVRGEPDGLGPRVEVSVEVLGEPIDVAPPAPKRSRSTRRAVRSGAGR